MINSQQSLSVKKYLLVKNLLNNSCDKHFFSKIDTLILSKCFDNAYEYSLIENIERINGCDLSGRDIFSIIENFMYSVEYKTIFNNRSLFELVKLSLLPARKLNKIISIDIYFKIATYLRYVSHEAKFISFDFLILRITNCFLLKIKDFNDENLLKAYLTLKNSIFKKMENFLYSPEKKDKETTFLCWIDMLLLAIVEKEIDVDCFICISKKILELSNHSIYIFWKLINSINYLLLQPDAPLFTSLKKYKTDLEKQIENQYTYIKLSSNDLQNIMINILAKQNIVKEDYYYFFDALTSVAKKSEKDKLFCIQLCEYLLYYSNKKNIFNYRFIRKYFTDTLLSLLNKNDIMQIKIKELQIIIELWFNDLFFCFDKKRLLFALINILKSINMSAIKLNHNNFYKYCDILDYILSTGDDFNVSDIIDFLAFDNGNKAKISKHFKLSLNKNYLNTPLFSNTKTPKYNV